MRAVQDDVFPVGKVGRAGAPSHCTKSWTCPAQRTCPHCAKRLDPAVAGHPSTLGQVSKGDPGLWAESSLKKTQYGQTIKCPLSPAILATLPNHRHCLLPSSSHFLPAPFNSPFVLPLRSQVTFVPSQSWAPFIPKTTFPMPLVSIKSLLRPLLWTQCCSRAVFGCPHKALRTVISRCSQLPALVEISSSGPLPHKQLDLSPPLPTTFLCGR